MRDEEILKSGC